MKKSDYRTLKRQQNNFSKSSKRRKQKRLRRANFQRYLEELRKYGETHGIPYNPPVLKKHINKGPLGKVPEYGDTISFLIPKYLEFSNKSLPEFENGILNIPETFSLTENNEESMYFLKRLFNVLHKQTNKNVIIDYQYCKYLDVDASAFMDVILVGFIHFFKKCTSRGHEVKTEKIQPINYQAPHIFNILFSIGCYRNIKGFELKRHTHSDYIPFSLRIGDTASDKRGTMKEVHETEIVDYVIDCLKEAGKTLTSDAESHLSKVVGEVMANAEEHSKFRFRFAIGYFLKPSKENNHLGTFKLSIFNFGQTIYESFKRDECRTFEVVKRMEELSSDFTKNGFFKRAQFEEQTLWTLYALQEGVTSTKDWKRGKGTIRFIDRFFKLKGNAIKDNLSKLTLVSGNTHIVFDGTYPLIEVKKGINGKKYQMMTFNDTGKIDEKPNENFVKFAPQYFPGTLITAKICITLNNIETN